MTHKRPGTLPLLALSLVGVIALGGCSTPTVEQNAVTTPASSVEAAPESSTASVPETASESPPAPASTPELKPATAPELPAGTQWAESSTQGIRFAVPDTWKAVDVKKLFTSGSQEDITAAAEDMGMTVEELKQASEQIDIMVMGPAVDQFAPNVNVVPTALKAMPTEAMMNSELESVGATVGEASTRSTAVGEAVMMPYVLELGAATIHGRAIVTPVSDGFASITVSHTADVDADALAEQLLSTLQQI